MPNRLKGVLMRIIIISVFITLTITSTAFAKNPLRYNYKVLKCIDSIFSKRKILNKGEVTKINSFLEKLDRKSPNLQKRNLKKCKSIKRDVKNYSRSSVDDEEMKTFIQQSALDKKDFLTNLIFPDKLECGGKEMTAQAAFLWGVKLGANVIICKYSNYTTRVWFGPHVGIYAGYGAMLGFREIKNDGFQTVRRAHDDLEYGSLIREGKNFLYYTKKNRSNYAILYGKEMEVDIVYKNKDDRAKSTGHNIGAGHIHQGATVGGGIKVIENRNWDRIFEDFLGS